MNKRFVFVFCKSTKHRTDYYGIKQFKFSGLLLSPFATILAAFPFAFLDIMLECIRLVHAEDIYEA